MSTRTPAQDAQQSNRTSDGRYTTKARDEGRLDWGQVCLVPPSSITALAGERVYDFAGERDPEDFLDHLSGADLVALYNQVGDDPDLRAEISRLLPHLDQGELGEVARQLAWAGALTRWFYGTGGEVIGRAVTYEDETQDRGRLLIVDPADFRDDADAAAANAEQWGYEQQAIWTRAVHANATKERQERFEALPPASGT